MNWIIQESAWAGLVNDSDALPMVQRSTVSRDPLRVWDMGTDHDADGAITQGPH
jgi:hypothetical protein